MTEGKVGVGAGPLTNRILNQRYELQERIGGGAMAVVYRAHDIALGGRAVAVKVLREQYATDEKFLARFTREAMAAAGLNHPNIVNVYDVGQDGEIHYIVMEYVEGETLRSYMNRVRVLSPETAAEIAAQICAALAAAHGIGLVHRDIKPQNVLISKQGIVKVTDFGIAKGLSEISMTETGVALGTVQYFSPEQARGMRVSPQSDLYSVGVILFEMLAGRLPFESDSMMGLALKHIEEQPPHPSQFNPTIPPGLDAIVMRALEKQPERRFASADEMERALHSYESYTYNPALTSGVTKPDPNGRTTMVDRPRQQIPPRQYVPPTPAPVRRATGYIEVEKSGGVGVATWIVGILVLAALVGGVLFITNVLPTLSNSPTPTPGPALVATDTPLPSFSPTPLPPTPLLNVIGKPQQEAVNALRAAGYPNIVTKQQTSKDVPLGSVVAQDPAAGNLVSHSDTITLTVSTGPRQFKLGNYRNTDANQTKSTLEQAGLVVQLQQQADPAPAGVVIGQQPDAGGTVAEGSTVILIVSTGLNGNGNGGDNGNGTLVGIPNVVGLSADEAKTQIRNAGLSVSATKFVARGEGGIDPANYDRVGNGSVLATNPPVGAQVPAGSPVELIVRQERLLGLRFEV